MKGDERSLCVCYDDVILGFATLAMMKASFIRDLDVRLVNYEEEYPVGVSQRTHNWFVSFWSPFKAIPNPNSVYRSENPTPPPPRPHTPALFPPPFIPPLPSPTLNSLRRSGAASESCRQLQLLHAPGEAAGRGLRICFSLRGPLPVLGVVPPSLRLSMEKKRQTPSFWGGGSPK